MLNIIIHQLTLTPSWLLISCIRAVRNLFISIGSPSRKVVAEDSHLKVLELRIAKEPIITERNELTGSAACFLSWIIFSSWSAYLSAGFGQRLVFSSIPYFAVGICYMFRKLKTEEIILYSSPFVLWNFFLT